MSWFYGPPINTDNDLAGTSTVAEHTSSGVATAVIELSGGLSAIAGHTSSGTAVVSRDLSGASTANDHTSSGDGVVVVVLSGDATVNSHTSDGLSVVVVEIAGDSTISEHASSGVLESANAKDLSGSSTIAEHTSSGVLLVTCVLTGGSTIGHTSNGTIGEIVHIPIGRHRVSTRRYSPEVEVSRALPVASARRYTAEVLCG